MDLHDRFLRVAERCRGLDVSSRHSELLRDCAQLRSIRLGGYRGFTDRFVAFVAQLPAMLHYSRGAMQADPLVLEIDLDGELGHKVFTEIRRLMQ